MISGVHLTTNAKYFISLLPEKKVLVIAVLMIGPELVCRLEEEQWLTMIFIYLP
jgi:hypothetical protein